MSGEVDWDAACEWLRQALAEAGHPDAIVALGPTGRPQLISSPRVVSRSTWWTACELVAGRMGRTHSCFPCYEQWQAGGAEGPSGCRNRLNVDRTYVLNPDAFAGPCEVAS